MTSIAIIYFDQLRGPTLYLSVPEDSINERLSNRMIDFINLDFGDYCFEINLPELELKTFNLHLDIPSKISRGSLDMVLITVISEKNYTSEVFQDFLQELRNIILNTPDMYKSFHKNDKAYFGDEDVNKYYEQLKQIIREKNNELAEKLKSLGESDLVMPKESKQIGLKKTLNQNIQTLTNNIVKKNNFEVIKYDFTEDDTGKIIIKMKIKGKGFLTRPLKRMTSALVYDGIKMYMLSNEIPNNKFEINVN